MHVSWKFVSRKVPVVQILYDIIPLNTLVSHRNSHARIVGEICPNASFTVDVWYFDKSLKLVTRVQDFLPIFHENSEHPPEFAESPNYKCPRLSLHRSQMS